MYALGRLFDVVQAIVPVDLETASNVSDIISLKNSHGVAVVVSKAVGSGTDDLVLTFEQCQDVAGTGAKNLAVVTEYYKKAAAAITGVGAWTRVTQAASQTVTLTGSATLQGLYVFEIQADQLDANNGFDCLRVTIADPGSAGAELGAMLFVLYDLANDAAPANLPNVIAD